MESSNVTNMDIFKSVGKVISDDSFNEAQQEFVNKNKDVFSSEDENKLEYTAIFESYVKIMEQLIESKLMEDHNVGSDQM